MTNKALMAHDLCATFHSFYTFNLWGLSDIITESLWFAGFCIQEGFNVKINVNLSSSPDELHC